ncbi:kinase-like domain-containing protein [Bisporella sp. PMI_857]|nr:kinase-like domain-containing protein [Bisporella sp. PMI_857]
MASIPGWRTGLTFVERHQNIEKLKKRIEAKGLNIDSNVMKIAFAAETDAYNSSESREAYDKACNAVITAAATPTEPEPRANTTPGITIGPYTECHHIAEGLVSQVYRSKTVALKLITAHDAPPHNAHLEIAILKKLSHSRIISLTTSFRSTSSDLVLVFPYQSLTFADLIDSGVLSLSTTKTLYRDIFQALKYLHNQGIIHRDIKPSNILLSSASGPALLADFGTAYHSTLSQPTEPVDHKVLEVGTSCYRAPETLFGNRAYTHTIDLWAAGAMLAEALTGTPLFSSSSDPSEDGNQLALILSMFKTLGSPSEETWPEATGWTVVPWEWYTRFEGRSWEEILGDVGEDARALVEALVVWESGDRLSAEQALGHSFLVEGQ